MSCNCGNCCNCCNCGNCCNNCNNPCNNVCSPDYINGLNQQYLNLDNQYNDNANEAMGANEALIDAMQNIKSIDQQQNCIVENIENCANPYDSYARNLINQLNCISDDLSDLYGSILRNSQQNEQILNEMECLGNQYNQILAKLVCYLTN